ncbi:MAG: four helix bundle protein [Bacteroidaceae bacterium]|nr:four helix bundle protein [Bacteroidaceae bacterium]
MNDNFSNVAQLYKELEDNLTFVKALDFAVRIVNLYKYLCDEKGETVMSKQVLRSGTSIGANISEALGAESKDDFIHKFSVSFKEGNETKFWLMLLHRTSYISDRQFESLMTDCQELRKLMGATIKTAKKNRT